MIPRNPGVDGEGMDTATVITVAELQALDLDKSSVLKHQTSRHLRRQRRCTTVALAVAFLLSLLIADAVIAAFTSGFDLEKITLRTEGPVSVKADLAGPATLGTRLHHAVVDHVECHLIGGSTSSVSIARARCPTRSRPLLGPPPPLIHTCSHRNTTRCRFSLSACRTSL